MPLQRTPHWDTREYNKWLMDHADDQFSWGTHDCCLVAADAIQSFTGTDLAAPFRGKYSTQAEAFSLIKTITGGLTVADAAAYCASQHGLIEYSHPLLAQRGDLVVVANGGNLIGGVVHLNGRHVISMSETGLVRLPITQVKRAWKI